MGTSYVPTKRYWKLIAAAVISIITFILVIICLWWSPRFTHALFLLFIAYQLALHVTINNTLTALQHADPEPDVCDMERPYG